MGMTTSVYAVSKADLQRILADGELVDGLLTAQPGSRAAAALPRRECDIDKAWNAIHFVLTGTIDESPMPFGFLINGGQDVGRDLGYGPARAFRPSEVASIAAALEPLGPDVFAARYNHSAMLEEGVYSTSEGNEEDDREYATVHFTALRELIAEANANGEGLVVALC